MYTFDSRVRYSEVGTDGNMTLIAYGHVSLGRYRSGHGLSAGAESGMDAVRVADLCQPVSASVRADRDRDGSL